MKVIKNNYKKEVFKTICPSCTSVLEMTDADIQYDRDGSYFICPCCHKFVDGSLIYKDYEEYPV
jgi:hypothetical protein